MTGSGRDAILAVAHALGPIRDEVVFVGGHLPALLVTDPGAVQVRMTDDVDVVAAVTTKTGYEQFSVRLRALGFRHAIGPHVPVCRWLTPNDLVVDVMPINEEVLGFANPWYVYGLETAQPYDLVVGLTIHILTAVVFLATKWAAFADRGHGDLYGSHDLEDIITVVAGRPAIVDEVHAALPRLREYVAHGTQHFLAHADARSAIEGALPDARFDARILSRTIERFEAIART